MRENPGEGRDIEALNSDELSLPGGEASLPLEQAHSPYSQTSGFSTLTGSIPV